eukprot:PhM_4_TR2551/c0_g1_i1/m.2926
MLQRCRVLSKGGRKVKGNFKSRTSDNTPTYDLDVEWLPRPARLGYYHLDEVRDWMMRETLDGKTEQFDYVRQLHRTWGGVPAIPVLGDTEPRFPVGVQKRNHSAPRKFLTKWHRANHPGIWLNRWLIPRAPWHHEERTMHSDHYPKMKYYYHNVNKGASANNKD